MLYLALNSASALLLPTNPGRVAKVRMTATESTAPAETKVFPTPAYEGLVLPYETGRMNDNINKKVNDEVNPFLFGIGGGSPKLAGGLTPVAPGVFKDLGSTGVFMKAIVDEGLLKSDPHSLDELQKFVRAGLDKQNAAAMPGLAPMPDDYNFFGGDDLAAQLCVILESNPFYASSLTPRAGGGFEIINFDPVATDPPYNVKILRTMGRPGPQVNFQFSVKPEGGLKIDGYDVFENGVKIENPPEHEPYKGSASPLQYFASATLYDLFYVSQTLHGPIHVLHYVLTNALKYASEDYTRLNKWAVDYNSNVNTKYGAVTKVLIALGGEGLLTSANGLGGCDASLPIMKANIEAWGACSTPTEFFEAWFQSPRKDLERAGLLTEFFKHTDLCAACAISATAALETKSEKMASTEEKLREYIDQSGAWAPEENGIKTVRSLLDIMLITGVIHGGTLSMTRLFGKPEFYRWRNIDEEKWNPNGDVFSSAIGLSTIMGVQEGKHVCGSKTTFSGSEEDITGGSLQKVLRTYDRQADKLKEVYEKKIQERPDFNDVGFILTDYCTDFYDGKQLTIATYI
mmetsp:Transcript_34686/g.81898  ORF Transcript_34686/g.81898 Transcript_34686/m.81898 type:complete len:573 (-) Transcript_34686:238-1956(-)